MQKIEQLKSNLHLIGAENLLGDAVDEDGSSSLIKRKHTIFVDTKAEAEQLDLAEHFDTLPELVDRTFNRPTKAQLQTASLAEAHRSLDRTTLKRAEKVRAANYSELASRLARDEKLKKVEREMDMQKALMGKGRKTKIGVDAVGLPMYKWKPDRKR
jgi:U3 small nucleolar RNA-associated protein 11